MSSTIIKSQKSFITKILNLIKYEGRINRVKHFGLFSVWLSLIILSLYCLKIYSARYFLIITIFVIAFCIINIIILMIRRLHDFNWTGLTAIIPAIAIGQIPPIGMIITAPIFFVPGSKDINKYGDKPEPAGLIYKLLCMLLPLVLTCILLFNYLGIPLLNKWYVYSTTDFSIKFPNPYKIETFSNNNVQYEFIISKTESFVLRVDRIDFKNCKEEEIKKFLSEMDLGDHLSNLLKVSPEVLVEKCFSFNTEKIQDISIILDKEVIYSSVPGRILFIKYSVEGQTLYAKAMVYIDEKNMQVYCISAYSTSMGWFDHDTAIIDYAFRSFTINNIAPRT